MLGREFPTSWRIPLREWTNELVDYLVVVLDPLFRGVSDGVLAVLYAIESAFLWLP